MGWFFLGFVLGGIIGIIYTGIATAACDDDNDKR